jgi:hypothetical protein
MIAVYMYQGGADMLMEWLSWLFNGSPETKPAEVPMEKLIEQAKQEWCLAHEIFRTSPDDEDLIDSASYMILAAERRYIYFLKKARQEKFCYSPYGNA